MRFHHIGIACEDINNTLLFIQKSFNIVSKTNIIFDPLQNVNLCMLKTKDGLNIELISGDTVFKFVKQKQYLYHNCWSVTNIEESIQTLVNNGALLISSPKPAVLFDNKKVAFLFSEIGFIELLEDISV